MSRSEESPLGGIYEIGTRGEQLLADHLRARGRKVEASDRKTFDMIVDGRYAEVKTSDGPYARLAFIGLTDAQYRALKDGTDFRIFVVCNAKSPDQLEVIEFDAAELLKKEPKIECTYYWYRSHLEKCRSPSGPAASVAQGGLLERRDSSHAAPPQANPTESQSDVAEFTAHIRRLAANKDAELYIRFAKSDVERLGLKDRQRVRIGLGGKIDVDGVVRTTGSAPWLSPAAGSSNSVITALLTKGGFKHADDVPAVLSRL